MAASKTLTIPEPNLQTAAFEIVGTAPYVQNKFAAKAKQMMRETQEAGSTSRKGRKKDPKDFEQCYRDAMHVSDDGWIGIPAPAFRCALISACRVCGFQMTKAKLSVFVLADGIDSDDGTPLVQIRTGEPEYHEMAVRNASGVADIRPRPMWRSWSAIVRVRYDGDQFTIDDVANLLVRAGQQVGVGEGRPDSKNSAGMGWGTFEITSRESE